MAKREREDCRACREQDANAIFGLRRAFEQAEISSMIVAVAKYHAQLSVTPVEGDEVNFGKRQMLLQLEAVVAKALVCFPPPTRPMVLGQLHEMGYTGQLPECRHTQQEATLLSVVSNHDEGHI